MMISYGQPAIIGRELCGDLRNLSSFRNILFIVIFNIGQPPVLPFSFPIAEISAKTPRQATAGRVLGNMNLS